jgi:hypothetical protein
VELSKGPRQLNGARHPIQERDFSHLNLLEAVVLNFCPPSPFYYGGVGFALALSLQALLVSSIVSSTNSTTRPSFRLLSRLRSRAIHSATVLQLRLSQLSFHVIQGITTRPIDCEPGRRPEALSKSRTRTRRARVHTRNSNHRIL